jgi:hypothetical protein
MVAVVGVAAARVAGDDRHSHRARHHADTWLKSITGAGLSSSQNSGAALSIWSNKSLPITTEGLAARGIVVSHYAVWHFLVREGITFKKNH